MAKKRHFLIFLVVAALFFGCIDSKTTEEPAAEPAKVLPTIPPSPTPDTANEEKKSEQFVIAIKNALLFDAIHDPFARNLSQEKGLCLLVVGSVKNNTDKILHRGGLFGMLSATFSDNVTIEKHTNGMGFEPEVSSEKPWRPGVWRDFKLVTRALDPIYREYTPKKLSGKLTLEVRDPLNFRLRQDLAEFSLNWSMLKGSRARGTAVITESVSPVGSNTFVGKSFSPGEIVQVNFQKGAGFHVYNEDNKGGWVSYRTLALDRNDFKLLEKKKLPITNTSESLKVVLKKVHVASDNKNNEANFTLRLVISNLKEKSVASIRGDDLRLDFGPYDESRGKLYILEDEKTRQVSSITIKPQESRTVLFVVDYKVMDPIELTLRYGSKERLTFPLI